MVGLKLNSEEKDEGLGRGKTKSTLERLLGAEETLASISWRYLSHLRSSWSYLDTIAFIKIKAAVLNV
jgi:hypothetical protein